MKYDFRYLFEKTGFDERVVEKVCRISDVLYEISLQEFLSKRLSLYGGSALNFIYFKDIPRLSVDLDFNYRQINEEDWGNTRNEIDIRLKKILRYLGYTDMAIQPTYPLLRMEVSYRNTKNLKDSFKIEIGYMRRIPILPKDVLGKFFHMGREEYFPVLTPMMEALFANKFCTMLYRSSARDLFDVYQIADFKMDTNVFRKCSVIESLMIGEKLHEINIENIVDSIKGDTTLKNLLRKREIPVDIKANARRFALRNIQSITSSEKKLIDNFYDKKEFTPEIVENIMFHPALKNHPGIKWALQNL